MTLLSFVCDLLGLAAICTLAVTINVVSSLLKLLMVGCLKLLLRASSRVPGMLRYVPAVKIQRLQKGSKTWLTFSIGQMTLAAAMKSRNEGGDCRDRTGGIEAHTD